MLLAFEIKDLLILVPLLCFFGFALGLRQALFRLRTQCPVCKEVVPLYHEYENHSIGFRCPCCGHTRESNGLGFRLDGSYGRLLRLASEWPPHNGSVPIVNLDTMSIGPLRFGDALDSVAKIGKPGPIGWTGKGATGWFQATGYAELLYPEAGFQLDFDEERFAYIAFFIGPDPHLPDWDPLRYSEPVVLGLGRNPWQLSQDTTRTEIEQKLGMPMKVDEDLDETVLFYVLHGVNLEFELDKSGQLKRFNLFPAEAWILDSLDRESREQVRSQ